MWSHCHCFQYTILRVIQKSESDKFCLATSDQSNVTLVYEVEPIFIHNIGIFIFISFIFTFNGIKHVRSLLQAHELLIARCFFFFFSFLWSCLCLWSATKTHSWTVSAWLLYKVTKLSQRRPSAAGMAANAPPWHHHRGRGRFKALWVFPTWSTLMSVWEAGSEEDTCVFDFTDKMKTGAQSYKLKTNLKRGRTNTLPKISFWSLVSNMFYSIEG